MENERMIGLLIGQLARQTGVKVTTIRFYERRGLLPTPLRRESGYRQYSPETVERIHFIKRAQQLGFTLEDIAELISLSADDDTSSFEVKERAELRLATIKDQIRMLQTLEQRLGKVVDRCSGRGSTETCPILRSLHVNNNHKENNP